LGSGFCQAYLRLRRQQWQEYAALGDTGSSVSPWERQMGLDG